VFPPPSFHLAGIGRLGPVFTAIIEREGSLYVALCPELDVASQGTSIESALDNPKEVHRIDSLARGIWHLPCHASDTRWSFEPDFGTTR
jgi:hypothetical protein